MIRGIILYYLNIKPTHGYEIQQFIQLSGMDHWTKIQSGSIYYALAKLEKEKNICVLREERTGSRVRKIYQITPDGKKTLYTEMEQELQTPLFQVSSSKFYTSPILSTLAKPDVEKCISAHLQELQNTLSYWTLWYERKNDTDKYGLTGLSFQMAIESLNRQIAWHQELLNHIDYYIEESFLLNKMIRSFDAESIKDLETVTDKDAQVKLLQNLKDTVAKDPQKALDNIDELIRKLTTEK